MQMYDIALCDAVYLPIRVSESQTCAKSRRTYHEALIYKNTGFEELMNPQLP